ncbi:MAG: hypothetical protein DRR19_10835 [Candidatus Parabeggiatoa sp. nov. 1]|nr:MAG: hypothetical protein DRR19_10835 [Gammaproteobacteria bacterium]
MEKTTNAPSKPMQCPACKQFHVETTIETDTFIYGIGLEAVDLTVTIPVRICSDCGRRFTDEVAEYVEHEAVCQHLGVMTPKEISTIRNGYNISQATLSEFMCIDEELLACWENGELIQNAAIDNLLYLLTFPENLERLKTRYANPIILK